MELGGPLLPFTGLGHGDERSRKWGRQIKEVRTTGGGAKRIKFWGVLPNCTHIRTKIRIIPPNKSNWQEKMAHVPVWNLHTIDYQHNRSTVTNWFCRCAKGSNICIVLTCNFVTKIGYHTNTRSFIVFSIFNGLMWSRKAKITKHSLYFWGRYRANKMSQKQSHESKLKKW